VADKKNFILRLDADVYKLLEKWAADEFRSVNGQLEWIIHQQLRAAGRMAGKKGMEEGKKGGKEEGKKEEGKKGQ
jgi:hypothetical protein